MASTILTDHDEFVEANPDVKVWLKDYDVGKTAPWESFIRDTIAAEANGLVAEWLGRKKAE